MIEVKDIYTNMTILIPNINQVSQWFYQNQITKNSRNYTYLQRSMKNKSVVYKHYLLTEIID